MKCNLSFKIRYAKISTNGLYIISTNADTPAPTIFRDFKNNISATPRPIAPLIISIKMSLESIKSGILIGLWLIKYNEKKIKITPNEFLNAFIKMGDVFLPNFLNNIIAEAQKKALNNENNSPN